MALGTYSVYDLNQFDLAISANNPAVMDVGYEVVQSQFVARLDAHNRQLAELLRPLVTWTDQEQMPFGSYDKTTRTRVDEPGRAKPKKGGLGYTVGLPFHQYQYSWQKTWHYFQQASVMQVAKDQLLMLDADARGLIADVLNAIMGGVNYDFVPTLYNRGVRVAYTLKVKALANADGLDLPPGPNGEYFDPTTHNHYAAVAGFPPSALSAAIDNVREHEANSAVEVWISKAQEVAVKAMTPNFVGYQIRDVVPPTTAQAILAPRLDVGNINDRAIGEFDGAVVRVKPQQPSNYVLVMETNAPMSVVAAHKEAALGDGQLVPLVRSRGDDENPMLAETYHRHHGMGAWNRVGAAVLQVNKSDGIYQAPTLAA